MSIPDWSPKPPQWSRDELNLLLSHLEEPPPTTLQTILEKSDAFPHEFPIESCRCKTLKASVDENILERNVNSSYPMVHESVLHLCGQYILHKRRYGNAIEKAVYEDMNVLQLIDRLLTKRAVTCSERYEYFTLFNGERDCFTWEIIGTPEERKPLLLQNCLSYEEIKLSGFVLMSSYTYFLNVGNDYNCGDYNEKRDGIQDEGVIIGIAGPRLDVKNVMDFQEVIITAEQNTKENGYGKRNKPTIHHLFANLYEEECLEFKEIVEKRRKARPSGQRYTNLKNGEILDNFVYYKRLLFSIDALFTEANQRALEKNTTAYIHVVGIGLGILMKSECQKKILLNTCKARIKTLGKHLHNVSDVCFTWLDEESCLEYQDGDTIPVEGHPLKEIKIHICNRIPNSRLTGDHQGKLLVVSYASNSNALPGNDFWNQTLAQDNNANTASSTQISELHNPFINPRVCASNLRVIVENSVMHVKQYMNVIKKRTK